MVRGGEQMDGSSSDHDYSVADSIKALRNEVASPEQPEIPRLTQALMDRCGELAQHISSLAEKLGPVSVKNDEPNAHPMEHTETPLGDLLARVDSQLRQHVSSLAELYHGLKL